METAPQLINVLKNGTGGFAPVVPFNPATDKLLSLDFTAANTSLTDAMLKDTAQFTTYVDRQLAGAGARYGIGGYNEHRTIYSRSGVFDAPAEATQAEPRRLHLGTDIWGPAGTAVMAPLDSMVHSFGYHPQLGNYGAVIILGHYYCGHTFYTLYGHLSKASIEHIEEGQRIAKGTTFASFGVPQENGWWPPHLHFQVMEGMQGWYGDYPGVCAFSQRDQWLSNCIDPDLILDLNRYIGA